MCKSRRGYLFPAFYYQLLINSCSVLLRLITGILWGGDQFWTETLRPLRASPP